MFVPSLAVQAAKRWRGLSAQFPPAAKSSASLTESLKSSDPATNRLHRLNNIASSEMARATVLEADTSADGGVSQTDVIRTIGQERIIGTRDLVDINFLELAIAVSRAVGRLQSQNMFATGCLIGPQLLITNHHVIPDAASAATWLFQLDYQQNALGDLLPVQTFRVDPGYFFYTDAKLDFTVVGVKSNSDKGRSLSDYPWVKLIADFGKIEAGDSINIIQHPMGGLKQIALRQNQVIALTNEQPDFLAYTTDTEPGSSGSPAFNDQWELVAVHHQSIPKTEGKQILTKDGKPWQKGESENDIDWIANEGVRVSATLKSLQSASLNPKMRAVLSHALALSPPNPVELARTPSAAVGIPPETVPDPEVATVSPIPQNFSGGITLPAQTTTFQIPLTISITLGKAIPNVGTPGSASSATSSPPPSNETVTIDPDYSSRPGYDPKFLGIDVPLPVLSDAQVLETAAVTTGQADSDLHELRYWNYSVKMNSSRRTAWFSAANVDGDERYQMPKRSGDRWFVDPRVETSAQLTQDAFETGIDRGHLTRREDAAWGPSMAEAQKATNDTFHFCNCSLQASPFNRGKDRWQGLEQFLLEQHAKKEKRRMVVITGPVFNSGDPSYRNAKMKYSVKCPLQFWKVCVLIKQDDDPSATGFILGQQDITELPGMEAFDVGASQVTIAQLEQKTGLDFGDLKTHDHFAQTGVHGELEDYVQGHKQRVIIKPSDIVI